MRVLVLTLACLVASVAQAQPADWRAMSKAQLDALTKEQSAPLPFFELVERTEPRADRTTMQTLIAMGLHRLYYAIDKPLTPTGPYLDAAVRELQSDLGAKVDGILTVGQSDEISRRVLAVDRTAYTVFPPFKRNVFMSGGYASFGGTWVIEGDKHAFPVNHTVYECYRDQMQCHAAEAYLINTGSTGTMAVESTTLKVLKWDAAELLIEESGECRISTLTVNVPASDVMMITRDKGSGCANSAVPKLAKPRISRLVDGFQSVQENNRAQSQETLKLYSKRWQQVVKGLKF